MGTLPLSGAEVVARQTAIARLQTVASEMGDFVTRLADQPDAPGLAQSPLAFAARAGWMYAQIALIQADAGMASPRMIHAIAEYDPALATRSLRRLAETTLLAAERRLHRFWPEPLPLEAAL